MSEHVLDFADCGGQLERVGGKCSSLGTMLGAGLPVPPGFAITTNAYLALLAQDGLGERIKAALVALDPKDMQQLEATSTSIRASIEQTPLPPDVEQAIREAYAQLCARVGVPDLPVAVRSSATAEDLPDASFAGQQDTFLWCVGAASVLEHTRKCFSSLYTARAIAYRHDHQFPHEAVLMSVAVQKMVNARAAGVAMTLNPVSGDRSKIVIDSSWGLGETVVSGTVTPDNFTVDKVLLELVKRNISAKHLEIVPDVESRRTLEREIESERQLEPSLTLEEVKHVAALAKRAEAHYGKPQDVEWALDADLEAPNNIVLLQSRPETVWSNKPSAPASANQYATGMSSILNTLMNPIAAKKKDEQ